MHVFSMELYDEVMTRLEEYLSVYGEKSKLGGILNVAPNVISRWFVKKGKQKREPTGRLLLAMIKAYGGKIVWADDKTRQPANGCMTPEAAHIDRWIARMREEGAAPESIRAFALSELEAQFEKSNPKLETEERKEAI